MVRQLILSFAVLLLAAGCASYTPSSAPVPAPVPDSELTSLEGYAASADPYVDPVLQETIFDADFHEAGLIAMQVVAMNDSEHPALVRRTDMMLTLPDGKRISPLSAHSAAIQVGEEGSVIGMTLAFGIIGGLAASGAEDTARNARIADYETKEFKEVTLGANESAHGFVFFKPPPGTDAFNEAMLDVRFVDVGTATSKVVSVPLKDLAFAGSEAGEATAAHEIRGLATASAVGPITTREEFEKLVVDRPVAGGDRGWDSIVIHSDGTMSGTRSDGVRLSGPWHFEGGYFCREPILNGESMGWDCQIVSVDGNEVAFARNRGKGKKVKYSFR
ncbi:MAG: hypothetical protein ACE5GS_12985 [Kiloniellaceae bacterium]